MQWLAEDLGNHIYKGTFLSSQMYGTAWLFWDQGALMLSQP
jgi:hypothetical protein